MRRRTGAASIAANPVLIGAATILVVIVAVYLAYNANSGLPFVPTYHVRVDVPNSAGLVKGNDVRIGGTRIGLVSGITPQSHPNGAVTAVIDLNLQTVAKPLPVDTLVIIRPRSALGLKYVQLTRGTSSRTVPDGGTLPLAQAKPEPVELDQVFNMFSDPTRRAIQANLLAFGNGFAGRGADLNFAIKDLDPLLTQLGPVMRNLSSTRTDLRGFLRGLARAAAVVAPAAETQAALYRNLDSTFSALAGVTTPIQQSIVGGVPALATAIRDLPQIRPFLANSADLFHQLQPGVNALANAAPDLADTVRIGTPVLQKSPAFNARVATTLKSVEAFSTDPLVKLGVNDLATAAGILEPTIAFITPAQTVCNYLGTALRNASSLLSEGGTNGTLQRFSIIAAPSGPNNEGSPSSAPANGPGPGNNFLHSNPYPFTAAPGQPKTCEAANEKFIPNKVVIGNVPGMAPTTLHDNTAP